MTILDTLYPSPSIMQELTPNVSCIYTKHNTSFIALTASACMADACAYQRPEEEGVLEQDEADEDEYQPGAPEPEQVV